MDVLKTRRLTVMQTGQTILAIIFLIAASTPAPLYLSMLAVGKIKLTVGGNTVLLDNTTNYSNKTPYEFTLTYSSLWSSGYLDVLFQSADGSTGNGPKLYWLEAGPDSYWRALIKHIEWDTTSVVWQMGYYDGTGN